MKTFVAVALLALLGTAMAQDTTDADLASLQSSIASYVPAIQAALAASPTIDLSSLKNIEAAGPQIEARIQALSPETQMQLAALAPQLDALAPQLDALGPSIEALISSLIPNAAAPATRSTGRKLMQA